jgi:hypothetical protein
MNFINFSSTVYSPPGPHLGLSREPAVYFAHASLVWRACHEVSTPD